MRFRIAILGIALVGGLSACATQQSGTATPGPSPVVASPGVKIGQSSLGPILTDQTGRTLYAFAADKEGQSSCTEDCLASWPALTSDKPFTVGDGADSKQLSAIKRTEGTEQATYNGWPMYYYVGDQAPGDIDGQNVDGLWF